MNELIVRDHFREEKLVLWYFYLTPVLWLAGLLIPMGILLILWLCLKREGRPFLKEPVVIAWLAIGIFQAISVFVNWHASDESLKTLLYRWVSFPVSGWFLLGGALAIGKGYSFQPERIARGAACLGFYIILLCVASIIHHRVTGMKSFYFLSPVGHFLPHDLPSVQFFYTVILYQTENFLGQEMPRMVLFYPWAVALGFAGIGIFFISFLEKSLFWKITGVIGGLSGILASHSRAAMLSFVVVGGIFLWLEADAGKKWLMVGIISMILLFPNVMGLSLINLGESFYQFIMDLRPGSSHARELGYLASWDGFLAAPLLGNGWPGDYVSRDIPMPIGTHSTVFGLLYTGGLAAFIPFGVAVVLTVCLLVLYSKTGGKVERSALAIMISLVMVCYGEGIYSFAVSAFIVFLWIGQALGNNRNVPLNFRGESLV